MRLCRTVLPAILLIALITLSNGCATVAPNNPAGTLQPQVNAQQTLQDADYLVHIVTVAFTQQGVKQFELSGFLYETNGEYFIITASHINCPGEIMLNTVVYLRNQPDIGHNATLIGYDRHIDTAVLKITDPDFIFDGRLPVLGDSNMLRTGNAVVVLGSPQGQRFRARDGKVTHPRVNIRVYGNPYSLLIFEHTGALGPGSSGGPVVNSNGEIIGMTISGSNQYSFATHINDIKRALPNLMNGAMQE